MNEAIVFILVGSLRSASVASGISGLGIGGEAGKRGTGDGRREFGDSNRLGSEGDRDGVRCNPEDDRDGGDGDREIEDGEKGDADRDQGDGERDCGDGEREAGGERCDGRVGTDGAGFFVSDDEVTGRSAVVAALSILDRLSCS